MRDGQTVNLCEQLRMEGVARFRDNFNRFECLHFADQEVLKLYQPKSVRRIGGRSTDLVLSANVGFVLRSEVDETGAKKWLDLPASLSLVPTMNFPHLIRHSALSEEGEPAPAYIDGLHSLMRKLPATSAEICKRFGDDFFSHSRLDRVTIMARKLRVTAS